MSPQSFTSAAKEMTRLAGLRWARVLPIYRALQQRSTAGSAREGWLPPMAELPLSGGRAIWAAHPNFMARLLIAVANTDEPDQARRMVETFIWATEKGEGSPPILQNKMAELLTVPEAAANVERMDFFPDTGRVCISHKSGDPAWFWIEEEELRPDGVVHDIKREPTLIRHNGAIDGQLFRQLCATIKWRGDDENPIVEASVAGGNE